MKRVVLIPGLWDSGPEHWQSYWERSHPEWRRVRQADWETPLLRDWISVLDREITSSGDEVLLAAHSLGCCTVAHWAAYASARSLQRVRGALLVAPSDVDAPSYPKGITGFAPMPLAPLPFKSVVVMSTDDQYVSPERAARFARAWGSELAGVGAKGHLNSSSALGEWPEGMALLQSL